jgi:hypothetical protein
MLGEAEVGGEGDESLRWQNKLPPGLAAMGRRYREPSYEVKLPWPTGRDILGDRPSEKQYKEGVF